MTIKLPSTESTVSIMHEAITMIFIEKGLCVIGDGEAWDIAAKCVREYLRLRRHYYCHRSRGCLLKYMNTSWAGK